MDDPRIAYLLGGGIPSAPDRSQQIADALMMTHQPEQPNPAAPAVDMGKLIAKHFWDKIVSAATAPRDALYGNMQVTDPETGMPTREAMERGQGVAGMAMTGGVPFAQRGAAGIFGGRLAKTADQAALEEATNMLKAGASKEDIWNKTGWFQGADDKWRFEIPDQASKFQGLNGEPLPTPARAALNHPEMYAAYPDLAGVNVNEKSFGIGAREHGQYRSGLGVDRPDIDVSWAAPDKRSTLLHEFQHGIQETEGFGRGTNSYGLRPGTPAWEIYQDRIKAMRTPLSHEEFSKQANYDGLAPKKDYDAYLKTTRNIPPMADRAAQEYAVQEAYRRHAGEVEARNVQFRKDMTPEQRRASPPWTTEDVPREQQIVRGATSGPQMSVGPYRTFYEISREYPTRSNDAFHRGADAYARGDASFRVPPSNLTKEELAAWDHGVEARMRFEAQPERASALADHLMRQ